MDDELKVIWNSYKESYSEEKYNNRKKGRTEQKVIWDQYKQKIIANDFTIDDYHICAEILKKEKKELKKSKLNKDIERIKEIETINNNGWCLTNFLLNRSNAFGKPGCHDANSFGVRQEKSGTYFISKTLLGTTNDKFNETKNTATTIFSVKLLPLLNNLISPEKSLDDKINSIKDCPFIDGILKTLLFKILVFENENNLLGIYDSSIDEFYKKCKDSNDDDLLKIIKNKLIVDLCREDFNLKDEKNVLIFSDFVWEHINADLDNILKGESRNVIFYGPPGTGKTFTVNKILSLISKKDNYCFVQFHPSYTYEDFIEGIKPMGFGENGELKLELVNGEFKNFCIMAKKKSEEKFFFIIDEINRANLSSVLGELLYCLEYRYTYDKNLKLEVNEELNYRTQKLIRTQYSNFIDNLDDKRKIELAFSVFKEKSYFGIPDNIYFIGMMNDTDRSIEAFDLALRRRFTWIRKECDYKILERYLNYDNYEDYIKCAKKLNEYIIERDGLNLGTSYQFGHAYFLKIDKYAKAKISISENDMSKLFDEVLSSTLREYLRLNYPESELMVKLEEAKKRFTKFILDEEV